MAKIKPLIASLAISLGVGGLSAWLTKDSMNIYETFIQPPLAPPGWLFPVVWTILYILMGIAAYLVWAENDPGRDDALWVYGAQLIFNFVWSLIFFNARRFGLAFLWLIVLWVLILVTVIRFRRINRTAGNLMLPYLAWVTFAAYLNAAIWILNK